jgi:hypothetical protein
MLLWPRVVCGSTAVPQNSPCPCLPKPSGHGWLAAREPSLFLPFNVKWRFSAPAGGVEGSKFCLFSVIMPAKCVSSVSPRFHYRRLTFCFLPVAAILEFLLTCILTMTLLYWFISSGGGAWFCFCTFLSIWEKLLHRKTCYLWTMTVSFLPS